MTSESVFMNIPEISIIIPCYNIAPLIRQTIQSVLAQPYENWELILINDGSTDNTEEILRTYESSRIKVITIQNGGAGHARNTGIDHATGKWIIFLDNDDLLLRESISFELIEKLKTYYSESADVVLTSSVKCDMSLSGIIRYYDGDQEYEVIPRREFWSGIYRRDFLIENGIRFFEYEVDIESAFRFRVVSKAKKIIGDRSIYFYCQREFMNSVSHTWHLPTVHFVKARVYKELLDECEDAKYIDWLRENLFNATELYFYSCNTVSDKRIKTMDSLVIKHVYFYGEKSLKKIGLKKTVCLFKLMMKANWKQLGFNKKKEVNENTGHTRSENDQRSQLSLDDEMIRKNLDSISLQAEEYFS